MNSNIPDLFKNSDDYLRQKAPLIIAERKNCGLDGLVGGLDSVIINVECERLEAAAAEMIHYLGFSIIDSFEDLEFFTIILRNKSYEHYILRSRKVDSNPFIQYNNHIKSASLLNTRLESFVFTTSDIEKYVEVQTRRGIKFLSEKIIKSRNYKFIQTAPSQYTGNSIGIIEWHSEKGNYFTHDAMPMPVSISTSPAPYTKNIKWLDHSATRVKCQDRDNAILEFMNLTNYNFNFAIYVESLNSITNVSRLSKDDFALVFTSGITPYIEGTDSGPTELFIHNYGTRVHHLAYNTENIEQTYKDLGADGMKYLVELVGSPEEGLKQTFTQQSKNTMIVTELIHRYGDFDGFFTKSNVSALTAATYKQ